MTRGRARLPQVKRSQACRCDSDLHVPAGPVLVSNSDGVADEPAESRYLESHSVSATVSLPGCSESASVPGRRHRRRRRRGVAGQPWAADDSALVKRRYPPSPPPGLPRTAAEAAGASQFEGANVSDADRRGYGPRWLEDGCLMMRSPKRM